MPIVQAPMAGISTPAMAAAVSNAGGLGSIAIGAGDIADEAVADVGLFDRVATHRQMFFTYGWMDYATLKPGSLKLLPHGDQLATWRSDYAEMQKEMFFGDAPDFDEILRVVGEFETKFNATA